MDAETISPRIIQFAGVKLKTAEHFYKDPKRYPGVSREWDWNETGTRYDRDQTLMDEHNLPYDVLQTQKTVERYNTLCTAGCRSAHSLNMRISKAHFILNDFK